MPMCGTSKVLHGGSVPARNQVTSVLVPALNRIAGGRLNGRPRTVPEIDFQI